MAAEIGLVDQVVRHQVFGLGLAQTFLDGALDAHQAGAELVLGQFAHATHAAVAQVIDVIDLATAVTQLDQHLDGFRMSSLVSVIGPVMSRHGPDDC